MCNKHNICSCIYYYTELYFGFVAFILVFFGKQWQRSHWNEKKNKKNILFETNRIYIRLTWMFCFCAKFQHNALSSWLFCVFFQQKTELNSIKNLQFLVSLYFLVICTCPFILFCFLLYSIHNILWMKVKSFHCHSIFLQFSNIFLYILKILNGTQCSRDVYGECFCFFWIKCIPADQHSFHSGKFN